MWRSNAISTYGRRQERAESIGDEENNYSKRSELLFAYHLLRGGEAMIKLIMIDCFTVHHGRVFSPWTFSRSGCGQCNSDGWAVAAQWTLAPLVINLGDTIVHTFEIFWIASYGIVERIILSDVIAKVTKYTALAVLVGIEDIFQLLIKDK
ncbi:hypothetical protein RRG08_058465 [Elysia crispata]|uniref:Uncharacterized protein n=1 Tax=Elysia crispata TaxID=231223 RepID=A0AAE0Y7R6_9GAST|nr:hypothetical protein RRG08_058465 [Elysia crispata]